MKYIIFDAIKTSLYVTLAIIIVTILKNKVLSKYSNNLKYIICILITLRLLVISNVEIYLPIDIFNKKSNTESKVIYDIVNESSLLSNFLITVSIIWLSVALFILVRNIYKQVIFQEKIKNLSHETYDSEVHNSLQIEKTILNIKKDIKVLKINGLSSPCLIGIINNTIALPNKDYDESELKWIFRHELIHYKRKDNIIKFLLMISTSLHWYNPFIKILEKYFDMYCELSCDEEVLKKSNSSEVKEYALVLVSYLKYKNTLKASMLSSSFNTNQANIIKNRVEDMLKFDNRKNGLSIFILMIIFSLTSVININTNIYNDNVFAEDIKNEEIISESVAPDIKEIERKFLEKHGSEYPGRKTYITESGEERNIFYNETSQVSFSIKNLGKKNSSN